VGGKEVVSTAGEVKGDIEVKETQEKEKRL